MWSTKLCLFFGEINSTLRLSMNLISNLSNEAAGEDNGLQVGLMLFILFMSYMRLYRLPHFTVNTFPAIIYLILKSKYKTNINNNTDTATAHCVTTEFQSNAMKDHIEIAITYIIIAINHPSTLDL